MPDGRPWPKISIVTPNYNRGEFLESTILSVLSQGYPNLEYIIIDDGSTDNSVEIIKKYENRIAFWRTRPNRGQTYSINEGFSHATGEIMAWLNSDDMYLPWTFSFVAEIFSSHWDVNWLVGNSSWWDVYDRLAVSAPVYKNIYDYLLGRYKWIQQESVFWRRALWEKAGARLNEHYKYAMDCELWCRFFLLDQLWHADCILGGFRYHGSNRSHLYEKIFTKEISTAISELQERCPGKVQKNLDSIKHKYKIIRSVAKFLKFIDAERISGFLLKKMPGGVEYKRLVFRNGHWAKTREAFKLSNLF